MVQLNEEITQLRADERHEMARILRELSNMLRPHTNIIRNNAWVLGHLDFVRAKFLFMQENKAVVSPSPPTFNLSQHQGLFQ